MGQRPRPQLDRSQPAYSAPAVAGDIATTGQDISAREVAGLAVPDADLERLGAALARLLLSAWQRRAEQGAISSGAGDPRAEPTASVGGHRS
jgi:hypothetical protein